MPIYRYKVKNGNKGCRLCREGFEILQGINEKPLEVCPQCGAGLRKVISEFALGFSKSGLDKRAKEQGFHKFKRVDKGKYEKLY